MRVFLVLEKYSYDLKQEQPLQIRIHSAHISEELAKSAERHVHPWDMNYTEWEVTVQEMPVEIQPARIH